MSTFRSLGILDYRVWFIGALIPNIVTCLPGLRLASMAGASPRAGTADGAGPAQARTTPSNADAQGATADLGGYFFSSPTT